MGFRERYEATCAQIAEECRRCGRDPREVRLLAVSKTVGPEEVARAVDAGCRRFGENRPEQLASKAALFPQASWHFIGNVQSRKIPQIVASASLVHSIYQAHHLAKFDAAAAAAGKVQDFLIEVNVSGEASKSGVAPDEAEAVLEASAGYGHIRACGLMTMAPQGDLQAARECFRGLAQLRDRLRDGLPARDAERFRELSMGMSEDWREAVAEGATIVRIGRALFSEGFSS